MLYNLCSKTSITYAKLYRGTHLKSKAHALVIKFKGLERHELLLPENLPCAEYLFLPFNMHFMLLNFFDYRYLSVSIKLMGSGVVQKVFCEFAAAKTSLNMISTICIYMHVFG